MGYLLYRLDVSLRKLSNQVCGSLGFFEVFFFSVDFFFLIALPALICHGIPSYQFDSFSFTKRPICFQKSLESE
jgi:hypothetical protein